MHRRARFARGRARLAGACEASFAAARLARDHDLVTTVMVAVNCRAIALAAQERVGLANALSSAAPHSAVLAGARIRSGSEWIWYARPSDAFGGRVLALQVTEGPLRVRALFSLVTV